jgi:hypothetical protein
LIPNVAKKSNGRHRALFLAALSACCVCDASALASDRGSVCLAPGAFDAFSKGGATVAAEQSHESLPEQAMGSESERFVQIDKIPPVRVTSSKSGKIAGISTVGRHLLRIAKHPDMAQPRTSLYFSFHDRGSDDLCLWYESFYGSWIIQPRKGSVCRCR